MQWYSENNKIIIQILGISIGLILIYFVYRLFFSEKNLEKNEAILKPNSTKETNESDNKKTPIVADKNNESKEAGEQTVLPALESDTANYSTSNNNASAQDSEDLQSLLKQMQINLKSTEEELAVTKQQLNAKMQTTQVNVVNDEPLTGDDKLLSKIDELQRKLSEYDIISEDISELQSLRKENTELKNQSKGM